jgi:hypothetical protein
MEGAAPRVLCGAVSHNEEHKRMERKLLTSAEWKEWEDEQRSVEFPPRPSYGFITRDFNSRKLPQPLKIEPDPQPSVETQLEFNLG